MRTVAFHTLGCKVNQYDTQAMLERFQAAGYTVVPFEEAADVYVLNTCTVTGTGDKKSMQLTRRLRREHPESHIVLCGCLAQRKGEELLSTGARLVLGTQRRAEVVELLERAIDEDRQLCAVEALAQAPFERLNITGQQEHTRATLKIQEGCNNHCTYCIIPSVRGPIRSRPLEEIRMEAERLACAGFSELVLTGIHLSSYGRDMEQRPTLLDAIAQVQAVPQVRRIRLGSLEPTIATPEFARRLREMDKVCPQFHLALQSGSDTVLARMARRYNTAMYLTGVENLRREFPQAAFTTDILTGFPGETEEEYAQTRRMIEQVGFAKIHVFPYSLREGTKAAAMPGQLSSAQKEQRARELIALGDAVGRRYREGFVGKEVEVLLEEPLSPTSWIGYTPEYLRVEIPCQDGAQGQYRRVRAVACTAEGLLGEKV